MSENKVRVRYGRVSERTPKNTLVTFRDGSWVYFGISRCNWTEGDVFKKSLGKKIASRRANLAPTDDTEHYEKLSNQYSDVFVHHSGLRGYVHLSNIKSLLNAFRDIDALLYERGIILHRTQDIEVA